ASDREPRRPDEHRREQPGIAEKRGPEHVGPVDARLRDVEVAREVGGGLEHRRVVARARPWRLKLSRAAAFALEGRRIDHKPFTDVRRLERDNGGNWASQP